MRVKEAVAKINMRMLRDAGELPAEEAIIAHKIEKK